MAIDKKYNNLTRKSVVIPAYSVATVEYNDSMPNYYRVMNMGEGKLYCGTSAIPTANRFEFSVGPHKIKLYTEPSRRNNLYIYNPSGVEVGAVIVSFEAEFDPATLALADLEFDMTTQIVQSESVITGFNQPLPAGSNKIGNVGISGALPAGSNNIGKVQVSNQKDYTEALAGLLSALNSTYYQDFTDYIQNLEAVDDEGETAICNAGNCHIHFISNDGNTEILLMLGAQSFTMKPGEKLENIKFNGTIKVKGKGDGAKCSFRALCAYP